MDASLYQQSQPQNRRSKRVKVIRNVDKVISRTRYIVRKKFFHFRAWCADERFKGSVERWQLLLKNNFKP